MRQPRTFRRTAFTLAVAGLCLTGLTGASSETDTKPSAERRQPPTLAGSYLSGRFAKKQHETGRAAEFYGVAMAQDPDSVVVLEQAFLMETSQGNFDRAQALADQVAQRLPSHRMARTLLGLSAFNAGNLDKAEEHFKAAGSGPLGELTLALTRSWVLLARNQAETALEILDSPRQPEWAQYYLRYHKALIADIAGRRADARATYERIFKQDPRTLRTMLAYAQHAANSGDHKLARSVVKEHLEKGPGEGHPLAKALRDELQQADVSKPMLVETPRQGLAEVFYGLGEALTNEGESGIEVGILYLQLALYLEPKFPFALASLANAYEATKRYATAIEVYDRIPKGSPLESTIEIRKAFNLNYLEKVDEARVLLEKQAAANPADLRPLDALGSIMRARKRHAEAIDYYSRAIALISKPERRHWTYFYSRGTSYERVKKWPLAEVDLQKALQLYPDQPLVLNYLGYSWIDQNRNLKQGMQLIEKAVALKPDDGFIVDSLGWAHYRLGNYKEAVRHLERAVELQPSDPVLNDHLGDALWRVGREREARFQWEQSLTLKPEPEDAEKTRQKLANGMSAPKQEARVPKKIKEAGRPEQPRKRAETKSEPQKNFFEQ